MVIIRKSAGIHYPLIMRSPSKCRTLAARQEFSRPDMTADCEIAARANFERVRYAQCWEDADVLLEALAIKPGDTCLSIAAAGDNVLAMVGAGARRVVAVDLNPSQIACLELRIAAFRELTHAEFLALAGQSSSESRLALYRRCRGHLSPAARRFWDSNPRLIRAGFARIGKFERFLAAFRRFALPLVQRQADVRRLFELTDDEARRRFYAERWNNRRWRLLCRLVFGQVSLGRFGRDPAFTAYADEPVWHSLERRIPHALVELEPAKNPYLQWILHGRYDTALPFAWREENFARIRNNLDAVELRCAPVETALAELGDNSLDACNLSDIFEYMSAPAYEALLRRLIAAGTPGCRLVYWNVVVARRRPERLAAALRPVADLAAVLHRQDKAFFYRDLVIEEVC
jgi:S-adenosylmethionine-diacylglycerol 3-amino-3-carboxypropyl transferase